MFILVSVDYSPVVRPGEGFRRYARYWGLYLLGYVRLSFSNQSDYITIAILETIYLRCVYVESSATMASFG